jgi:tRNA 5-methylaminomethyl-2-thiouridine biosynthesis bifunctional protein
MRLTALAMTASSKVQVRFLDGVPYSDTYQDVYYSKQDGLAESRYVFLQANNLSERWGGCRSFTIGETGFGTGLNFLATWQLWKQSINRPDRLHYISVEENPLEGSLLAQCHQQFPELEDYSQELVKHYPTPVRGFHRIWLDRHRVCLTLCIAEANEALSQLSVDCDCWFLDGFAPAKNPKMWTPELFREIARLSHSGTTLSTFTAARKVRDRLSEVGFAVKIYPGYGSKRDMTIALMEDLPPYREPEPWFEVPLNQNRSQSAVIVGAGIAGAQIAWHLAKRGWQVTLLERHPETGLEGSGNPAAVVAPKITAGPSVEELLSVQCFHYLLAQLDYLELKNNTWSQCGVLNLACTKDKADQWHRISERNLDSSIVQCILAKDASKIAGIEIEHDALYYPTAGYLTPRNLIQALLAQDGISVSRNSEAAKISKHGDCWSVYDRAGGLLANAPVIVIASGRNLSFEQTTTLPITPVLGQTTKVEATNLSKQLKTVVQYKGYFTPAKENFHLLGATYQRGIDQPALHARSDYDNFLKLEQSLPALSESIGKIVPAHAAIRATSPSRMPYIGAVADENAITSNFRPMHRRNYNRLRNQQNYIAGLYVTAAYGSRGITNAALGAELLASIICNEPIPVQSKLYYCVHPARHIIRQLKRHPPD